MHIVYHHRTTGQDAQGIHIREIIRAFHTLGHTTELVSFADRRRQSSDGDANATSEAAESSSRTGAAGPRTTGADSSRTGSGQPAGERYTWLQRVRALPWIYECAELAYNVWGLWALSRAIRKRRPQLLYERYSLFNFCGISTLR